MHDLVSDVQLMSDTLQGRRGDRRVDRKQGGNTSTCMNTYKYMYTNVCIDAGAIQESQTKVYIRIHM